VGKVFQSGRADQGVAVSLAAGERQPDHVVGYLLPGFRVAVLSRVYRELPLKPLVSGETAVPDPGRVFAAQ
jgi:hypothetical protein